MSKKEKDEYKILAEQHADFLCDKVFKPAFVMGFIHGAKHAQEDNQKKETDNE